MISQSVKQPYIAAVAAAAGSLDSVSDSEVLRLITLEVARRAQGTEGSSLAARKALIRSIFETMRGLDCLQPLVDDPEITEIMVNGPRRIFIERNGKLESTALAFDDAEHLTQVVTRFFGRANKRINAQTPIADLRLSDGSRVHAVLPPAAPNGPVVCIRRFVGLRPTMPELVRVGALSDDAATFLHDLVTRRHNLFISGGTGTGKTTMLNALSTFIGSDERIVVIEDAMELHLPTIANLVRLEARPPGPDGQGALTLTDLIRSSLRLRPDRIIVGEVRGVEAYDMLQAMQTGHPGSMSTGHGNSARAMLERLSLLLLSGSHLPWDACRRLVAQSVHGLIHLERRTDGQRIVGSIARVVPDPTDAYRLEPCFVRDAKGRLVRVA